MSMAFSNKVIILGVNNGSTLGLVRCLGYMGVDLFCVIYGDKKGWVFSSKYSSKSEYVEDAVAGLEFIVHNFKGELERPILIGSNDESANAIDSRYDELKGDFYMSNAGNTGAITKLMDKDFSSKKAQEYGFVLPECTILYKHRDIPHDLSYPLFTKSLRTIDGGKKDEMICHNRAELLNAQSQICADTFLAQQYIEKEVEINYYGFSYGGEVYIPYINYRPRFSEKGFGGYHIFKKNNVEDDVSHRVINMMRSTDYQGMFSVEFLKGKDGTLYFMEVNYRHDGDTILLEPGINLPYYYCLSEINGFLTTPPFDSLKDNIIGMREYVDFKQSVIGGKVPLFKWLFQLFTADSHIVWSNRDVKPGLFFIFSMIKNKLFIK